MLPSRNYFAHDPEQAAQLLRQRGYTALNDRSIGMLWQRQQLYIFLAADGELVALGASKKAAVAAAALLGEHIVNEGVRS
jgi:hypothetical protein